MRTITLGRTGITVPQNAFGALPIQRIDEAAAVRLLRRAYEGGMRYFDTARAYSDSESKLGAAFEGMRDKVFIATKTQAKNPADFWRDLETSLRELRTDYIDVYQLHCVKQCYRPGDGTGMYEALLEAKAQGKIRHMIGVAEELIASGLYETLQFPFSYLSTERDLALARACADADMGFIAMKGLAGGLLTNAEACMAFMLQHEALPIWGIQRETELEQWLSFFEREPELTPELAAVIEADRAALAGDFCRGCGYCMPCTVGITINHCARISQMVRRAPSEIWLNAHWQAEMAKIDDCLECGLCMSRCPYGLEIPALLRKNLEDYRAILDGSITI